MARRIQWSIVGDVSRLRKGINTAEKSLSKFRGAALKGAAGLAALNSAATLGHAAVILLASAIALLPLALAGIGIAGAAMHKEVRTAFGDLKKDALSTLKDIGKPLVGPLVDGAKSLGRAFQSVAPYLKQISREAAPLVRGFFAKVEAFADKVGPKLPAMFRNAIPVLQGFMALFGRIGKSLGDLFSGDLLSGGNLKASLTAAGEVIGGFIDRIREVADILAPFIQQVAAGLQPVVDAVVAAFDALLQKLAPVSAWFKEHPTIIQAVATAIGIVVVALTAFSVIMSIVNAVMLLSPFTWIVLGIVALIAVIILCIKHWDKIKAAMSKLWGWVKGVFAKGWDWLKTKLSNAVQGFVAANARAWSLVKSALAKAVAWYVGLPGRIVRAVGSFGRLLISKGRDLVAGLSSGAVNRWNGLRSWLRGIGGRVIGAVGGLGRKLYSAGRDLLAGMIEGVKSMAGRLISSVTGPIGSAIGKAKSLLGIASPSKVFREIGKFTMQGYADGVGRYARTARSAVESALDPGALTLSAPGAGNGGGDIHIHVEATPGTDKVALAKEIASILRAGKAAGVNF